MTPGQHLRAEIERLGLDQVAVRKATGVSRQTINNIVNDRQPISRAMAGKLGRLTGHGSDYWLRASFSSAPRAEHPAKTRAAVRPIGGGVLVNYQIAQAVKKGIIGMEPFDEANVRLTSVDLTLGDFLITPEGKKINIGGGHGFTLKHNCTVNVSTKERIELPPDHVGRVGAIMSLAKNGIFTSAAFQLAPGFNGHLHFCIFNSGRESLELRSGMPIVSIEIMSLSVLPLMNGAGVEQPRRGRRRP
ncbi:MAG: helix-turn-helix domain-containing protein [Rhizobiales bacterium]|nr:helix-turn-helix domain-containing protein [Hyphomicrobiales bacterium]